MNKRQIVNEVAALSGVPSESCEKVIDAFEKVMAKELSAKGGFKTIGKVAGWLHRLSEPNRKDDEEKSFYP